MAKTSKDVQFFGEIKVSVLRVDGGYAVGRSDIEERVFLDESGKPYKTHTDAIKGVDSIIACMYNELMRNGYVKKFFFCTPEKIDKYFGTYIEPINVKQ